MLRLQKISKYIALDRMLFPSFTFLRQIGIVVGCRRVDRVFLNELEKTDGLPIVVTVINGPLTGRLDQLHFTTTAM